MKKLMTLLFSFVLVFSLAMPVFAQDTTSTDTPAPKTSKKEKKAKTKKVKKSKKSSKMATGDDTTK
jgi:hypothetical protein